MTPARAGVDHRTLADPARLAAVATWRETVPRLPVAPDAVARMAARLLSAPMAAWTLLTGDEEHLLGGYGIPPGWYAGREPAPLSSPGAYVVSAGRPMRRADVNTGEFTQLRAYGISAFLGVPVRDRAGRVLGSLTVLDTRPHAWTDPDTMVLTELEQLLRAPASGAPSADGFLDALLDSLSVGVVACDAGGRVALINRAMRAVHGIPDGARALADYTESAADVLLDKDEQPLRLDEMPLTRARSGEYVDDTDIVIAVPGRRKRTFAVTARPITGADGARQGAVVVTHEVTALRRVEQFRECHRRVGRELKDAATTAAAAPGVLEAVGTTLGWPAAELFLVDDTTGELRAVGHWNEARDEPQDFFDHVPVRGLGATGRVWQEGNPVWIPRLARIAEHGTPFERSRAAICVQHGINTVLAVPVQDGNEVLGVLTCYAGAAEHDEDLLTVLLEGVAAQIGAFVTLRRAESLTRELARMQDDFLSLVGHELRTPLASISAHVGMLGEDRADYGPDSRMMIDSMTRNVTELHGIVGSLLDLAGLESGHLPLTVDVTDLTALVVRSVEDARAEAAHRGLELRADAGATIVVVGDGDRLRQVANHLLANAVKYSEPGGAVSLVLTGDGDIAELRVSDDGIGLPDGEHERVFDRFFRGSNVRHHGIPGSGLGLSIVRTIVRLHGGSISLRRNHPGGTTVVVRMPAGGAVASHGPRAGL